MDCIVSYREGIKESKLNCSLKRQGSPGKERLSKRDSLDIRKPKEPSEELHCGEPRGRLGEEERFSGSEGPTAG